MKASGSIFLILLFSVSLATADSAFDSFIKCLPNHSNPSNPILENVYTPNNSLFQSTLQAYIKNLRFMTPKTPKPLAIIAAKDESQVQATVICAKSNGLQIRIRSGGHDYEGLSFTSNVPFVILDMFNLRAIKVKDDLRYAQVQAGATIGELYYWIANRTKILAFPGGVCFTLGTGGHFSGGGYGNLMRKYGLSIDNIADVRIVDANGKILDRKSMGQDLFWALLGGGGASFGVILEWKIELVDVPNTVTVFRISRNLEQGATDIVHRWQQVAPDLDKDAFIRMKAAVVNGSKIEVFFTGLFLGKAEKLLQLMKKSFPELGLKRQDCKEMTWIESTLFFAEFPDGTSIDVLLERPAKTEYFSKSKSDYVKEIITKSDLEEIWKLMIEFGPMWMQWNPYGGRMSEISDTESPFPHRAGYRSLIQYVIAWKDEGIDVEKQTNLIRKMYEAMSPYVTKNPREAFLNYRDIDIGSNPSNFTDFKEAEVYGHKYFKQNFLRLAKVKAKVDPENFFKHEQSIPPLFS